MTLNEQSIIQRLNDLPFPPTFYERGSGSKKHWIYGVWYCGTSFQKAELHGQFPKTFVRRVTAAFPPGELDFLHLCCGVEFIPDATNVDIVDRRKNKQDHTVKFVPSNAEALPFKDNSFDVALIDPPYSQEDSSRYGVARLISPKKTLTEVYRVLRPGGWFLWLDEKFPNRVKEQWDIVGLVGIITGANRRARVLTWFRSMKSV